MDCNQIQELLDAYALGAAEADEAAALEEHVADCVRCWSSLNEAQRAAAAIALSTAFRRAPQSLRERILAETRDNERAAGQDLLGRLRRLWPAGAGVLGLGAAASLAFAVFSQLQVNDLRGDKDLLTTQVEDAGGVLTEQRELMAVLAAPDVQQIRLEATDPASAAVGVYHWSKQAKMGALLCDNLPELQPGQVYKVWVMTEGGAYSVGSFGAWNGIGQLGVDLESIKGRATAIGMSIEDSALVQEPSEMLLYGKLDQ